jgi:type VI secretion system protein ImpH
LPGAPLHTRLVELTRLQVGLEVDFAFNPVLAAPEVPSLRLGASGAGAARLGWTSWLTAPRPRRKPGAEAMLRPQPQPVRQRSAALHKE